jgi:hypothetical protein
VAGAAAVCAAKARLAPAPVSAAAARPLVAPTITPRRQGSLSPELISLSPKCVAQQRTRSMLAARRASGRISLKELSPLAVESRGSPFRQLSAS